MVFVIKLHSTEARTPNQSFSKLKKETSSSCWGIGFPKGLTTASTKEIVFMNYFPLCDTVGSRLFLKAIFRICRVTK